MAHKPQVLPITAGGTGVILKPSFSAFLGTTDSNVTGDGTLYTLGNTDIGNTLTELYDYGSNFTPGASGGAVFTAPLAGSYQFNYFILFQQFDGSSHNPVINLVTTSKTYTFGNAVTPIAGNFPMNLSINIPLALNDTVLFKANVSGGTKVVDIFGSATAPRTVVGGYYIGPSS